ncbi:hypothetical protein Cfor_02694 [Coptotermes formosanus]|uniref:Reverse transcriptase domain-containing protein n=1 Tax=Coptotermes formosanus TaxID=36987 RepID=A0A6L2PQU2_COPFO|nr:hypothetical protein Cfor_02694 [Coptotermes formosanus]
MCKTYQLSPKYANIKVKGTDIRNWKTLKAATRFGINQALKFLDIKKEKRNQQLYHAHLTGAYTWKVTWRIILGSIDKNLKMMEEKYDKLNHKLESLRKEQHAQKQRQAARTTSPKHNPSTQGFHTRTMNLSTVEFTTEETSLIDLGLQYCVEKPPNACLQDMIIEIKRAIKIVAPSEQQALRKMATIKLNRIINSRPTQNHLHKRQRYTARKLRNKLSENNLIIVPGDKGKTLSKTRQDPTTTYVKQIQRALKERPDITDKHKIKHLTRIHRVRPTLTARLKIHKPNIPIRPAVNNINAPSYKVARFMAKNLNVYLNPRNTYNTINSHALAQDISKLTINEHCKLVTTLKTCYVNIPLHETLHIAYFFLRINNKTPIRSQILGLMQATLEQNYYRFDQEFYQPHKGTATSSPLSGLVAEIFLQYFELHIVKHSLETKSIIFYRRYVDDILILYDESR